MWVYLNPNPDVFSYLTSISSGTAGSNIDWIKKGGEKKNMLAHELKPNLP